MTTRVCIAPACPIDCLGCQHSIDFSTARQYAVRWAVAREHLSALAHEARGLNPRGADAAADRLLLTKEPTT